MKRLIATSPAVLGGVAATLVVGAGAAIAAWRVRSDDVVVTARTATLSPGNKPVVEAEGNLVALSWKPNRFGDRAVDGYQIRRYDLSGAAQSPSGGCEEQVVDSNCTDSGVPAGSWRYTVTPVKGGWTGPESEPSDTVVVAPGGQAVVPHTPDPPPAVVERTAPAPTSRPTWTVQAGADGVLGPGDTLTYAGGTPIVPGAVVAGWSGAAMPVTVRATAGRPALLTVVDGGGNPVLGPLAVPGGAAPADASFPGTLAAAGGRIVLTLGTPREGRAPSYRPGDRKGPFLRWPHPSATALPTSGPATSGTDGPGGRGGPPDSPPADPQTPARSQPTGGDPGDPPAGGQRTESTPAEPTTPPPA